MSINARALTSAGIGGNVLMCRRLFAELDVDKDGTLDTGELQVHMCPLYHVPFPLSL
jgi:hypothetical protein